MSIIKSKRMLFLLFVAMCAVFIFTVFPSHAYIERGDVEIGAPGSKQLQIGETTSLSITPFREDHLPGCQMAECPAICGEKDCIIMINGQKECTCAGTDPVTYYAVVDTSSSDPSVATVSYDDNGSVIVTAVGEGSAQISVSAEFREYAPASKNFTVKVEKISEPQDSDKDSGKPGEDNNGGIGEETPDNNSGNSGEVKPDDNTGNSGGVEPDNNGENSGGVKPDENTGNSGGAKPDNNGENSGGVKPDNNSGNSGEIKPDENTGNSGGVKPDNNGSGSSDTATLYPINLASSEESHAVITSDKKEAAEGSVVMIHASATAGYQLNGIVITGPKGERVTTKGTGGIYEFTMPAGEVNITADVFELVPEVKKEFPFTDIAENRWSRSSIEFVYNRDLFNGTSETLFSPEITMTRGMLVTVLYRLEGKPEVSENSHFVDVDPGQYYAKPVKWASDHEIVLGMEEGIFAPDQTITREQLVTIMYRYAKFKGYNVNFTGTLQDYSDDNRMISNYAEVPFKWAVSREIVTGVSPTSLAPQGSATREQVATILMRFVQKYVK